MSLFLRGIASFAFSNADAISVSVTDAMTFLRVVKRNVDFPISWCILRFVVVSRKEKTPANSAVTFGNRKIRAGTTHVQNHIAPVTS